MDDHDQAGWSTGAKPRGRDLGLPFPGTPGPHNAITDVAGVEVGYATLVEDPAPGSVEGPARTGVTVVLPRGRSGPITAPVWAGLHSLNGNGEMTGTHWIKEAGYFVGPVGITNTHSLGTVHQAFIRWITRRLGPELGAYTWLLPVVGTDGLHDHGRPLRRDLPDAALSAGALRALVPRASRRAWVRRPAVGGTSGRGAARGETAASACDRRRVGAYRARTGTRREGHSVRRGYYRRPGNTTVSHRCGAILKIDD
jgi:L-aminopeptidase/D-esterase-like protein